MCKGERLEIEATLPWWGGSELPAVYLDTEVFSDAGGLTRLLQLNNIYTESTCKHMYIHREYM